MLDNRIDLKSKLEIKAWFTEAMEYFRVFQKKYDKILRLNRGGDSASGRRDVGQKWEREAGGEVKSIWDVGG